MWKDTTLLKFAKCEACKQKQWLFNRDWATPVCVYCRKRFDNDYKD